jgi:arsenate reductase
MTIVVFACIHNAGRSQMAAALFNLVCDPAKARAISAASSPAPACIEVQARDGRTRRRSVGQAPQKLTADPRQASFLITMGCGDQCPVVGARCATTGRCPIEGPPIDEVRAIRDDVRGRVERFGTQVADAG